MDGSVLEEKSSFKMVGLPLFSKLDWSSYIISIAKTTSKKIGALIHSVKFLSPEVALYLYKSTIDPYMEYCCHILTSAPSCYLEWLDKQQKWICRTVGWLSELVQLVPLPYPLGRSTRYSDRLHDFSVVIPRCYKDVYVNSFFPHTARLRNSLTTEIGFKSRIKRHLTVGSF